MAVIVKCPSCARSLEWSSTNPWRPFCSERCKLVDLGAWLKEERAIAGEPASGIGPQVDPEDPRH
jgi:endogenous inhibitor of DNA gyrase (YacG/DUF329 family)